MFHFSMKLCYSGPCQSESKYFLVEFNKFIILSILAELWTLQPEKPLTLVHGIPKAVLSPYFLHILTTLETKLDKQLNGWLDAAQAEISDIQTVKAIIGP